MATKAVVLAAGQGTRMRSDIPKVLHRVAGRPMIAWVMDAVSGIDPDQIMVVVGQQGDMIIEYLPEGASTCLQEEQLGTGHATQIALASLGDVSEDTVLVVAGDAPMLTPETLEQLVAVQRRTGAAASLLTMEIEKPHGYGRILRDGWDRVVGVVEHKDASLAQRAIREVNGGVYAFDGGRLAGALKRLDADNVQGELYLPDVVSIFASQDLSLTALRVDPEELAGVNSQGQLATAARIMRRRIATKWMERGVWMQDPEEVYIAPEVSIGEDTRIYAGVHLEGKTTIGPGAQIGPDTFVTSSVIGAGARVWYSVLREAEVGEEAEVGPYVSLRPGTVLGKRAKAGSFVEMKNAVVGEGSKVPHLSYMGDVTIGKNSNIGAGTITCNYDGAEKHSTVIGDDVFVGSDTMLVAPLEIGDGASTGAGSTITKDVSSNALAVERAEQREIPEYKKRRRRKGSD